NAVCEFAYLIDDTPGIEHGQGPPNTVASDLGTGLASLPLRRCCSSFGSKPLSLHLSLQWGPIRHYTSSLTSTGSPPGRHPNTFRLYCIREDLFVVIPSVKK